MKADRNDIAQLSRVAREVFNSIVDEIGEEPRKEIVVAMADPAVDNLGSVRSIIATSRDRG